MKYIMGFVNDIQVRLMMMLLFIGTETLVTQPV
jgi:hypothetical protein